MTRTHSTRQSAEALETIGATSVPDGIPPKLLLNIIENIVSHSTMLYKDAPDWCVQSGLHFVGSAPR